MSGDWNGSRTDKQGRVEYLRPIDGRMPPKDLDAEAAVLSAIILASGTPADVEDYKRRIDDALLVLRPEHFFSDANQKIFQAVVELSAADRSVDVLTVRSWLQDRDLLQRVGGAAYLAQILDSVPAISNIGEYANKIIEKWRMRRLISSGQRIVAEAYGTVEDPRAFIDAAEEEIFEIASDREARREPVDIRVAIRDRFIAMQESVGQGTKGMVRIGIKPCDDLVVGFNPGDLVFVAARPGVGKSALTMNNIVLSNAENEIGCAVFSLEMPKDQLIDRVLCSEAFVDSRNIPLGKVQKEDWSRLTVAAERVASLPIKVDDEPMLSVTAIRAKARRIKSDFSKRGIKLGLIVIDYLQLMEVNPKIQNRDQQIAENTRRLKALAKSMKCVVLVVCAMNRDSEKRGGKRSRPKLADLRESGSIEYDADVILFLHDPEEDAEDGVAPIEFIVGKGRNYGKGLIRIGLQKAYTRFAALERGYSEEDEA